MAQKVQTFLIDDLDGSDAEGTVRFGLDGEQYEIDLSTEHAKELRTSPGPLYRRRQEGYRHGQAGRPERAQGSREQHQQHRGTHLGQSAGA